MGRTIPHWPKLIFHNFSERSASHSLSEFPSVLAASKSKLTQAVATRSSEAKHPTLQNPSKTPPSSLPLLLRPEPRATRGRPKSTKGGQQPRRQAPPGGRPRDTSAASEGAQNGPCCMAMENSNTTGCYHEVDGIPDGSRIVRSSCSRGFSATKKMRRRCSRMTFKFIGVMSRGVTQALKMCTPRKTRKS